MDRLSRLRFLLVALVLYLAVAVVYLTVVPPLEGFDSIAHQNYINYLRHTGQLPPLTSETVAYSYQLVQQPPLYYLLGAALTLPFPYHDWDRYVHAAENEYFPTLSPRWTVDLPNAPPGLGVSLWAARLVSLLGGLLAVVAAWLWVGAAWQGSCSAPGWANPKADDHAEHQAEAAQPVLILAAVALFALNPLFLFISTTITNDSWAIAGAVGVMWLTTRLARNPHASLGQWGALGLVAGVAALIKYSVLVLIFPVAAILIFAYRRTLSNLVLGAGVAMGSAILVAGFWYGRNLLLYGELIPLQRLTALIPTLHRAEALGPRAMLENLEWLFTSYWGVFVAIFAPIEFYRFWYGFVAVGIIGLLWTLWRAYKNVQRAYTGQAHTGWAYGVALVWIVGVSGAVLWWMRTIAYGEQARLLLIAGPAIALLLVLGWRAWIPARWHAALGYMLTALLVGVALWPVPTLVENYRPPSSIEEEQFAATSSTFQPVEATFAPGMELLGFDLPQGRALQADESRPLVLYWTTDSPIDEDYTLFAHIADADDTMWYQFDGVPAGGLHPTRQWQPGEVFSMTLALVPEPALAQELSPVAPCTLEPLDLSQFGQDIPAQVTSAQDVVDDAATNGELPEPAQLSVGFYPRGEPQARAPLAETTAAGEPAGDRVPLAEVRLVPAAVTPSTNGDEDANSGADADAQATVAPVAAWQNGIRLHTAQAQWETSWETSEDGSGDIEQSAGQLWLDMEWTTTTLMPENLTVFVHLLDEDGTLIAQADQEPCAGALPTSTWLIDEPVADRYMLTVPGASLPVDSHANPATPPRFQVHIGWYDVQTGERILRARPVEDKLMEESRAEGEPEAGADFLRLLVEFAREGAAPVIRR